MSKRSINFKLVLLGKHTIMLFESIVCDAWCILDDRIFWFIEVEMEKTIESVEKREMLLHGEDESRMTIPFPSKQGHRT